MKFVSSTILPNSLLFPWFHSPFLYIFIFIYTMKGEIKHDKRKYYRTNTKKSREK